MATTSHPPAHLPSPICVNQPNPPTRKKTPLFQKTPLEAKPFHPLLVSPSARSVHPPNPAMFTYIHCMYTHAGAHQPYPPLHSYPTPINPSADTPRIIQPIHPSPAVGRKKKKSLQNRQPSKRRNNLNYITRSGTQRRMTVHWYTSYRDKKVESK